MNKMLQSKKRGSAIPLAVVAVVILLAMGTGLLSLGLNIRIFSIRTASDITARSAADAGLRCQNISIYQQFESTRSC